MFSLIITIISVVLVGLLTVATIYYIGSTEDRVQQAKVQKVLNENAQVSGALTIYRQDKGGPPEELQDLVAEGYLTSALSQEFVAEEDYIVTGVDGREQCVLINKQIGIVDPATGEGLIPACTDPAYAGKSYCCETP